MKLRLLDIKNLEVPLSNLINQRLPLKTSFKLSKVIKEISDNLQLVEEQRQKLIKEYGELNEEDQSITITDPEKLATFQNEYNEFLKDEIDLNYEPISIEELGPDVNLTLSEVTTISILFTS
jgi:hypothetical protein